MFSPSVPSAGVEFARALVRVIYARAVYVAACLYADALSGYA